MTTLRSLLYNQGQKNQCSQSFCTTALNVNACTFNLIPHCGNTNDGSYNNNCMLGWCVPSDAKCCVTFELIGGGGGGPGACCCQSGVPGGAGAYAVKTLLINSGSGRDGVGGCCVKPNNQGNLSVGTTPSILNQGMPGTDNAGNYCTGAFSGINAGPANAYTYTQPGCCYCLMAGGATDCAVDWRGCVGCTSWVQGQGLCNLCAEGGVFGRGCCFFYWGSFSTCPSICNLNSYLTLSNSFVETCSCYYGAECGAPGHVGYAYTFCANTDNCYWKQGIAFPGGLINQGGGHVLMRVQGNACNQEWLRCATSIGFPIQADSGGTGYVPGTGGLAVTACGNPCCYGFPGSAGFIRITYR